MEVFQAIPANMTSSTPLEIQLHLANGHVHRFVQDDPQAVEQILGAINPRVFAQPHLTLFGAQSVATYPTAALTGIALKMEPMPESLLRMANKIPNGVAEVREISQADYHAKLSQLKPFAAGQPGVSLNEIEFICGQRLWLEVKLQAASGEMQERQLVKHAFEGPSLICHRRGGGVSLWNRARMVSYRFAPGPDVPVSALPAEPMREN